MWFHEKLHLENARKLRGIYFIDPKNKEFKETIKNARKKLETSVAPATLYKIVTNCGEWWIQQEEKQILLAFWRLMNPQECLWETRYRQHREDHIAGKGEHSLQHYNMVHKCIPMPQAMKFLQRKQRWTRNGKIRENFCVELDKSQK